MSSVAIPASRDVAYQVDVPWAGELAGVRVEACMSATVVRRSQGVVLCLQEIWPPETTQVEGNKDALDSPFLASDDPDMQDIIVST
jgi:hypothetical protein